jgi:hypothetical protein
MSARGDVLAEAHEAISAVLLAGERARAGSAPSEVDQRELESMLRHARQRLGGAMHSDDGAAPKPFHATSETAKARALKVAKALAQLASDARARAAEEAEAERRAFMADDQDSAEAHAAHSMVSRGRAIAYEDAEVQVALLATWIPEGV